jgi:hypothetical protein
MMQLEDHAEPTSICQENDNEETTPCAHTQFLVNFPVMVDTNGNVLRDFYPSEKHFNKVMSGLKNTILSRKDAVDVAHLFLALRTIHKATLRDIGARTSPMDGTWTFKWVGLGWSPPAPNCSTEEECVGAGSSTGE